METTTTAPLALKRSPHNWVQAAELRALLKQTLGLKVTQVTVRRDHSTQYLKVIVRDAAVDVAALESFIAPFVTWSMDQSDYCEGQSIHVETTPEVKAAHAAPFIAEVKALAPTIALNHGEQLSTGALLWHTDRGFYVSADGGNRRSCYIWQSDVLMGAEYAIAALALGVATLAKGGGL